MDWVCILNIIVVVDKMLKFLIFEKFYLYWEYGWIGK